jgi:hypothetical protein
MVGKTPSINTLDVFSIFERVAEAVFPAISLIRTTPDEISFMMIPSKSRSSSSTSYPKVKDSVPLPDK